MLFSYDTSLKKRIPTGSERFKLEFRADAINVLNHANFLMSKNGKFVFGSLNCHSSNVDNPIHSANYSNSLTFGALQQAGSPRMIKLGLKASF